MAGKCKVFPILLALCMVFTTGCSPAGVSAQEEAAQHASAAPSGGDGAVSSQLPEEGASEKGASEKGASEEADNAGDPDGEADGASGGQGADGESGETEGQSAPPQTSPSGGSGGDGGGLPAGGGTSGGNASGSTASGGGTRKPVQGVGYPSTSGALRVEGSQLVDSNGKAIQLRGISTHGLAWFPQYVNEAAFRQFRYEWNVNVVRLAMYTAEYGGYCTGGNQEQLKNLVRKGVEYATAQDMYVIVDWHVLYDRDPNTYLAQAKAFFAQMSREFAGHNNVLYEICNEPNGSTSWSRVKAYAEEIIPVIRSNDPDAVIIVGTPDWCKDLGQAAADPITSAKNIMYSLHFYAATHTDWLRSSMVSAIQAGLPVFVSEYGICDASGNGAINESQANQWVEVMNRYGVSYVVWSLSNKAETASILNSSCTKVSGFTEGDLSASGRWLYKMLTGNSAFQTSSGGEGSGQSNAAAQTPGTGTGGQGSAGSTSATPKPTAPAAATTPVSTPAPTPAPGNGGEESGQGVQLTGADLQFTATLVNSWQANGQSFYHYTLTVRNISGKQGSSWRVEVPFSGAVTLSDGWNGEYQVRGSTLTITAKDYNGAVSAGGQVDNIGFIVSGEEGLTIVQ